MGRRVTVLCNNITNQLLIIYFCSKFQICIPVFEALAIILLEILLHTNGLRMNQHVMLNNEIVVISNPSSCVEIAHLLAASNVSPVHKGLEQELRGAALDDIHKQWNQIISMWHGTGALHLWHG